MKGGIMKGLAIVIGIVSFFSLLLTTESFAQRGMKWQGSGGWGMGTPYQRMYDPAKVETISGTVESVDRIAPVKGMYPAVALTVKTDKETITVHLGPEWYIGRLDAKIAKGDSVEVKGSRVTFGDKPVIIAGEIKKGDKVLQLRDNAGVPVWAGWRR
jgi:hypothetical protein